MTPEPSSTRESSAAIGKLCVGGDWACTNGDLGGLRYVAQQLAGYVSEPIHCDLEALADVCLSAPDHAAALWDAVKNRVYREVCRS